LVGLTATPYRGVNVEETNRLIERYGRSRLDDGVFDGDPYRALQQLGMLAEVEHRVLSGAELTLNDRELEAMSIGGLLPASAEQRLAGNEARTRRILDEIASFPADWPVLLFATSVDHARLLAARLNDRGIKSAAVASDTPTPDRRSRIDEFRAGKIRVLTNYGVLAQGFDAPATRAVVVARPTYSPNVYQQMIGRGLRGPKNGGEDSCLILNVQDNITNYGETLAFTAFEHLWGGK
jgi:superfamily II DNA or RNA helicase